MRKLLMLLFPLCLLSCAKEKQDPKDLTNYLPADAAVIVKLQNPDHFFHSLASNSFLRNNSDHPLPRHLRNRLTILRHFETSVPALLSFSETSGKLSFTYIQNGLPEIHLDSVQNKIVETITTDIGELKKYTLEDQVTYTTSIDSIFVISDSQKHLENLLQGTGTPLANINDFQTALKASSEEKPVIVINHDRLSSLASYLLPNAPLPDFESFSKWTALDIDLSATAIKLNGVSLASDSLQKTIKLFKGVAPSANELSKVVPVNSQGFFSFSFEHFAPLKQQLSVGSVESEELQLLSDATEAGIIYLADASAFAVRALNIEIPTSAFHPQRTTAEEFHGITIYNYEGNGFGFLQPLATPEGLNFFMFLDEFLIFGKKTGPLKEIITAFQNGNTLYGNSAYGNTFNNLSTESSLLWVINTSRYKDKLKGLVAEDYQKATEELQVDDYPFAAIQFINQDNFAHVNAILTKSEAEVAQAQVAQAASITLDAPVLSLPVFFNNHRTKGLDLVVQDIENTLYLISPEGKIHWKKKLDSPILGKIQQVDLYKNGRYQLAFATANSVQVLDRDGNRVKPFPLEFNDKITQPLAIFDYDANKRYRFLVVQGNEVFMYDGNAKGVRGFDFRKTAEEIALQPKHIRIGRKDYILLQETSGKLNFLSRTGEHRIKLKEHLSLSDNEWYEYNNAFVNTDAEGNLLKISEKGQLTKETLGLADNHRITATAKTLVTLSDNLLTIKGKTVELDFGLYTEPQIFYLNNKIYVSLTDTQAHKVYLFDSNAELLPGFPVYGNSSIDLGNANGNRDLELVVKGDENSILVYEM